jgi:MoxR-like ATPase
VGRDFVTPSDVQAVALYVLIHRITPKGTYESATAKALIVTALQSVEVDR